MRTLKDLAVEEINCLVAKELGFEVKERWLDTGIIILNLLHNGNTVIRPVNYCEDPSDYMPIAIAELIAIDYDKLGTVSADFTKDDTFKENHDPDDYIFSRYLPKSETGRAVCECFLMIKGYV